MDHERLVKILMNQTVQFSILQQWDAMDDYFSTTKPSPLHKPCAKRRVMHNACASAPSLYLPNYLTWEKKSSITSPPRTRPTELYIHTYLTKPTHPILNLSSNQLPIMAFCITFGTHGTLPIQTKQKPQTNIMAQNSQTNYKAMKA